jgi:hypothetical protein
MKEPKRLSPRQKKGWSDADLNFAKKLDSRWRKIPDTPLGEGVRVQLRERKFLRKTAGRGPSGRARYRGRYHLGLTDDSEEG